MSSNESSEKPQREKLNKNKRKKERYFINSSIKCHKHLKALGKNKVVYSPLHNKPPSKMNEVKENSLHYSDIFNVTSTERLNGILKENLCWCYFHQFWFIYIMWKIDGLSTVPSSADIGFPFLNISAFLALVARLWSYLSEKSLRTNYKSVCTILRTSQLDVTRKICSHYFSARTLNFVLTSLNRKHNIFLFILLNNIEGFSLSFFLSLYFNKRKENMKIVFLSMAFSILFVLTQFYEEVYMW